MTQPIYTTKLQAGLGLIPETEKLLDLWEPGMDGRALLELALASGDFPTLTARRLRNVVIEGFAPRYLVHEGKPAAQLKALKPATSPMERRQLLFLFTCRANAILADFVRDLYWPQYAAGSSHVSKREALTFVEDAVADGRTTNHWSGSTKTRVARYLLGACVDFGLLGRMVRGARTIESFRPTHFTATFLAHDLHFQGLGDNAMVQHEDWRLFGLGPNDALAEIKRIALSGEVIVQSAAGFVEISWKRRSMEEFAHAVAGR